MELSRRSLHDFKEKMSAEIRAMCEADLAELIDLFTFPWSSKEETTHKWRRYFEEQNKGLRTVWLVVENGHLKGYGSLLHNAHLPEIHDIWIDEKHRCRGLGSMLIHGLEDLARQKHKEICIGVGLYKDYGSAQRLYVQLGYVPNGQGITYRGTPVKPGEIYPVDDDLILWLVKKL